MYYMLVTCMAGPMNTGQNIITYLLLQLIPIVIHHLDYLILPEDPMSFRILAKTIAETSAWQLRGHPHDARPKRFKCFKKPKMKMVSKDTQDKTITKKPPSYLALALFAAFKIGCRVKSKLRRFLCPIQRAPRFLALQSASLGNPTIRFDTELFKIGIDNNASQCMANAPHLFEDLHLIDDAGEVYGIGNGLEIKGKGTFLFSLADDNEKSTQSKSQTVSTYLV
jgi:hypothetical protein